MMPLIGWVNSYPRLAHPVSTLTVSPASEITSGSQVRRIGSSCSGDDDPEVSAVSRGSCLRPEPEITHGGVTTQEKLSKSNVTLDDDGNDDVNAVKTTATRNQ